MESQVLINFFSVLKNEMVTVSYNLRENTAPLTITGIVYEVEAELTITGTVSEVEEKKVTILVKTPISITGEPDKIPVPIYFASINGIKYFPKKR